MQSVQREINFYIPNSFAGEVGFFPLIQWPSSMVFGNDSLRADIVSLTFLAIIVSYTLPLIKY